MSDTRKPIKWLRTKRTTSRADIADTFKLREDRGWHWLQRFCFWVLRKIGAHAEEVTEVFTRYPEQNDDLLKALLGQEHEWRRIAHYAHHDRCKLRVYMGPDRYRDLPKLCDFRGGGHFTLDARIKLTDREVGPRFHDIPITVVPWLEGAFIVPVE